LPVYNHYYPDSQNLINTPESAQRLSALGPVVPVAISLTLVQSNILRSTGATLPAPVLGQALIDTGASLCVIDETALTTLGIPPFGLTRIATPQGVSMRPTYPASISFPGTNLPNVAFRNFIGAPLATMGVVAIVGRNVLENFVFIYNGPGGSISLSH